MNRVTRILLVVVPTIVAIVLVGRLHFTGDLSSLFPTRGSAAMLGRVTKAFGGGDTGIFLVRGDDPSEVSSAADELAASLRKRASVSEVIDRAPTPSQDPTLAWQYAGPDARSKLHRALTPEGMRERLAGSKELLLSPTAKDAEDWLAQDPLRLSLVPWESRIELAAGLSASSSGDFSADEGRARLVVVLPKGRAFDPEAAAAFVRDANASIDELKRAHPKVRIEATGGHVVAVEMRQMLQSDLAVSGTLSMVLAAVVFLLTFRRLRALVAVMPPLALGTLWTLGGAALLPDGLSAMSIAFAAVVIGVGVDTGVHVYAALLEGRRNGLSPADAAEFARKKTARPTMLAAIAAGLTFGALALSDLRALRELGLLCGAGEVLTSLAILLVTPEIGRWLERGAAAPELKPAWIDRLLTVTASPARARLSLTLVALPFLVLAIAGWPRAGDAIVALRPKTVASLRVQSEVFGLFGGKPGQWMVVSADADPARARDRADRVAEALDEMVADHTIEGYDALASYSPGPALLAERLRARDDERLPEAAAHLKEALIANGWDADACEAALVAFAHPTTPTNDGAPAWLSSRHLAQENSETLAVSYVRPRGERALDAAAVARITAADPGAVITGYPFLESALKDTLASDLPKIAAVALLFVCIALSASLRSVRDVVLATLTLIVALAIVGAAMRLLGIHWHAYDALVVPVLLGITMDEAMFLLHAAQAREGEQDGVAHALREQGPLVLSTALTTSAGFIALVVCRFDGLRDVGAVGAIGSLAGLVSALLIVPAGLRLANSKQPR